jgi:tetratricopeptide (TPR) repeat protein
MAFGGENAESYYDEGLTALMKGDVAHAEEYFTRAIQMDHTLIVAYHQLGKCYMRMGQARRSSEMLAQVVSRKPEFVPAKLDLGQALLQQGELEKARQQFSQVLAFQPQNPKAHLGMGQVSFQEGNWPAAVSMAQAARAMGGPNFSVLFLLGRAAKLSGNTMLADESLNEAEALIEKSVELSPDMPEGYYLRGEVCFVQERFGSAMDHYRAAEDRADPKRHYAAFGENFTRADLMLKRGLCLQRLGNIAGAREVGEQVLAMAPENKLAQSLRNLQ